MEEPDLLILPPSIVFLATFLCLSSIVSWGYVLIRWHFRLPILPTSPRSRVPWGGGDVLLLILTYYVAMGLAFHMVTKVLEIPEKRMVVAADEPDSAHAVVKVLQEGLSTGRPWVLAIAMIGTVLVAPIFEEFLFRVVFQGWLEAVDARFRAAVLPFGFVPITITSAFFALLHFRTADGAAPEFSFLVALLASTLVVSVLMMLASIVYLRVVRGATAADLGWRRETFLPDVRLGVCSACAVLAPLFVIQIVAQILLPDTIAADPIPIFVLSVALGFLYLRTHRVVPCIVLHMCLNGLSLFMAIVVFSAS